MDGQTHLVLIREEAGAPDAKVRGGGGTRLARVSIGHGSLLWLARTPSEWYPEWWGLYDPRFALPSPASSQAGRML